MLDIDTLLTVGVILALFLALGLSYALWPSSGQTGPEERSMRIWLWAIGVQAAFWLLFVFGRDLPPLISTVAINTLSVLAMAEYARAIRHFIGLREQRRVLYSAVALVALGNVWFGLITPDYDARVLVVSLVGAAVMGWTAISALSHREAGMRRAVNIIAVVFLSGVASMLLRAADTLIHPGLAISRSVPQQAALLVYANLPIFASLGFLLMLAGRTNARLTQRASTDALTGALNRRGFESAAQRVLAGCQRAKRPASLLLIDVDEFKRINDEHGHDAGDAALTALHTCLRDALREEDVIARLGGEEFVVLLPGASTHDAEIVAERLRGHVSGTSIVRADRALRLTVSIGVAQWQPAHGELADLLCRADQAMYAAKRDGRNRVRVSP